MDTQEPTVSVLVEIPQSLHQLLVDYLEQHPDWDLDRTVSAAISMFLLQNHSECQPK